MNTESVAEREVELVAAKAEYDAALQDWQQPGLSRQHGEEVQALVKQAKNMAKAQWEAAKW